MAIYNITIINLRVSFECESNQLILDAAEAANITLPYSGRAGEDSSSAAKLVSGDVRMIDNFLTPEQRTAGYFLTDAAYPIMNCIIRTHVEEELQNFTGGEVYAPRITGHKTVNY